MNTFIEQAVGGAAALNRRRLLAIGYGVLVLAIAVTAVAWWANDAGDRSAPSVATGAAGAAAPNLAPLHASGTDNGRLTIYLVGSHADTSAAYARIAADQELRAQNFASSLNASVVVAGTADEERQSREWVAAVREGLGVPVDVIDLRAAPTTAAVQSHDCRTDIPQFVIAC
jgi:hypothetical protein